MWAGLLELDSSIMSFGKQLSDYFSPGSEKAAPLLYTPRKFADHYRIIGGCLYLRRSEQVFGMERRDFPQATVDR